MAKIVFKFTAKLRQTTLPANFCRVNQGLIVSSKQKSTNKWITTPYTIRKDRVKPQSEGKFKDIDRIY